MFVFHDLKINVLNYVDVLIVSLTYSILLVKSYLPTPSGSLSRSLSSLRVEIWLGCKNLPSNLNGEKIARVALFFCYYALIFFFFWNQCLCNKLRMILKGSKILYSAWCAESSSRMKKEALNVASVCFCVLLFDKLISNVWNLWAQRRVLWSLVGRTEFDCLNFLRINRSDTYWLIFIQV